MRHIKTFSQLNESNDAQTIKDILNDVAKGWYGEKLGKAAVRKFKDNIYTVALKSRRAPGHVWDTAYGAQDDFAEEIAKVLPKEWLEDMPKVGTRGATADVIVMRLTKKGIDNVGELSLF